MQIARGFDAAVLLLWRKVRGGAVWLWLALKLWWSSPWFTATGAALFFGLSTFGRATPLWGFVLGCLWLYLSVARAIRGPSFTLLGKRDPAARGLFRIRLATLGLVVALLANHSDYGALTAAGYFAFAVVLLLGLDKDISE